MGIFKAIKDAKNLVSSDNGVGADAVVGRGLVIDASLAGMAITMGVEEYRVVNIRVQVFLDGQQAYIAECRQKVEEWRLSQLVGQAFAGWLRSENFLQTLSQSGEMAGITVGSPRQ